MENGYVSLENRKWKNGDRIDINFEMPVRKVVANENVKEDSGKVAFERGPLVYCAEEIDNPGGVLNVGIDKNESLAYSFDQELLNGAGKIEGETITAIPYYAWAHRGIGEMAVWLKYKE